MATANDVLSPESQALVDLIASSTAAIEQAYRLGGQPLPHLGPSTAPDTGSDRGVGILPSAEFIHAVQVLKGATTQLLATFAPPPVYGAELALASLDTAAIGIAVESRVADVIHKHDPDASKGVPVQVVADEAGLEPRHLARILRSLATKHVFVEVRPDVFANNRHSSVLRSHTPASCVNAFGHWAYDVMPAATKLPDVLSDREHAAAFSVVHSGASRAFEAVFWDFLKTQPQRGRRFNEAMKELTQLVSVTESIVQDVPWAEEFGARNPQGIFVDVGAGAGHQALSIAPKLPGWEFVIEDLPEVIDTSAKELWHSSGSQYKHRLVPQNFFEPQVIKGADVYYMKHIIHDWPDKECITILKHLREAADPARSRLLISEVLMEAPLPPRPSSPSFSFTCSATSTTSPPLLANLGAGASMAHKLDMIMMTVLEAQERTQAEFEHNVLAPAGWKLAKIHQTRSHVRLAVLECVPV
ncbi:hypothetical protein OC842_000318 [Tilletia horrida]|uniref:O-methyltransferase domain-containing protein n=1 Tax=Tilletia horrida TaxID=155126 RepID=A0AAN6GK39_9BASI|nr:hypothetical protein OC842_000318 [Tilletia horrida]